VIKERQDQHLRLMVERLQREGRPEWEIVRAVEDASGEPVGEERPGLRRQVQLGRWRLEVSRL